MHHFDSLTALAEVAAVQSHFRSVLWFLRQRRPAGLDPAQKAARALLLDELEAYAARGVFPLNTRFPGERKPAFIDEVGTRCAVAHLLDLSGEEALALEVRDRMNFAPVSDIVEDARFVAWLEAAGFTREEIALVQPSYCDVTPSDCVCSMAGAVDATYAFVSYRQNADGTTVVTEVHRGLPGVEVGLMLVRSDQSPDQKPVATESVGTERFGWVSAPEQNIDKKPYARIYTSSPLAIGASNVECSEWGVKSLPLTKEQAVKALLSAGPAACRDYLVSLDGNWDDGAGCGGGCDMSNVAASSPASLAVLAAIVGAIAARRRRSR